MLNVASSLALVASLSLSGAAYSSSIGISMGAAAASGVAPAIFVAQDEAPPADDVCGDLYDAWEEAQEDAIQATQEAITAQELKKAWCDGSNETLCAIAEALVKSSILKAEQAAADAAAALQAWIDCLLGKGSLQLVPDSAQAELRSSLLAGNGSEALPLPVNSVLLGR